MTKPTGDRGASAIEFALVLPLLLLILFGIIEFSILLYDKAMLTNASREGARLGIVFKAVNDPTSPYFGERDNFCTDEIAQRVRDYASANLITFATGVTPTIRTFCAADCMNFTECETCPATITEGQCLRVLVTYDYNFLVLQVLTGLFPGTTWPELLTIQADTVMRME